MLFLLRNQHCSVVALGWWGGLLATQGGCSLEMGFGQRSLPGLSDYYCFRKNFPLLQLSKKSMGLFIPQCSHLSSPGQSTVPSLTFTCPESIPKGKVERGPCLLGPPLSWGIERVASNWSLYLESLGLRAWISNRKSKETDSYRRTS